MWNTLLENGGKEPGWINSRPHHAQTMTSIEKGRTILLLIRHSSFLSRFIWKKRKCEVRHTANEIITQTLIQWKSKKLKGLFLLWPSLWSTWACGGWQLTLDCDGGGFDFFDFDHLKLPEKYWNVISFSYLYQVFLSFLFDIFSRIRSSAPLLRRGPAGATGLRVHQGFVSRSRWTSPHRPVD
jgi:hypothetical protein